MSSKESINKWQTKIRDELTLKQLMPEQGVILPVQATMKNV